MIISAVVVKRAFTEDNETGYMVENCVNGIKFADKSALERLMNFPIIFLGVVVGGMVTHYLLHKKSFVLFLIFR